MNKMRLIIFFTFLMFFSIYSFSQEITIEDFKKIDSIKAEIGESEGKKKAQKLEELYIKFNNNSKFQKALFKYLLQTDYKNVDNYFWFSTYFMSTYYNSTINNNLALKLLKKGRKDIETRIKDKQYSEEQTLYLDMARCQVLWQTGIYYFKEKKPIKGSMFFDNAYENPNCIYTFPAMTETARNAIYLDYEKYRKK